MKQYLLRKFSKASFSILRNCSTASKRMLGRLFRESHPPKSKILDRARWVHHNRVYVSWWPNPSEHVFRVKKYFCPTNSLRCWTRSKVACDVLFIPCCKLFKFQQKIAPTIYIYIFNNMCLCVRAFFSIHWWPWRFVFVLDHASCMLQPWLSWRYIVGNLYSNTCLSGSVLEAVVIFLPCTLPTCPETGWQKSRWIGTLWPSTLSQISFHLAFENRWILSFQGPGSADAGSHGSNSLVAIGWSVIRVFAFVYTENKVKLEIVQLFPAHFHPPVL